MVTSHNLVGERTGAWLWGDTLGMHTQPTLMGLSQPWPALAAPGWRLCVQATCRACSPVGDEGGGRRRYSCRKSTAFSGTSSMCPPQNTENG